MSLTVRPATFLVLPIGLMFSVCCGEGSTPPPPPPKEITLKLSVGAKTVKNVHAWLGPVNAPQDSAVQPQLLCPEARAPADRRELFCKVQQNPAEYECKTLVEQSGTYEVNALALDEEDEMKAFGCIVATAKASLPVTLDQMPGGPPLEMSLQLTTLERASCHVCAEIAMEGQATGQVTVVSDSAPTPRKIGPGEGYYYPLGESVTATAVSDVGMAISSSLSDKSRRGCAAGTSGECRFRAWSAAKLSVTFK